MRAYLELIRAPAALSVPGDVLAGAAAAGWPYRRATAGVVASSVCLYWAGMALNDYADREIDAVERPERPIPSGRVGPRTALAVAGGLTAAGLGLAAYAGRGRALAVAVPLAGAVWAYDLKLKSTPAASAAMAVARGLNVLMGSGAGRARSAAPAAATVALHTYTVTNLSRHEVEGATSSVPRATLAASTLVAAAATYGRRGRRAAERTAPALCATAYLGAYGRPQLTAAADPSAENVRSAVGAGIHGLPLLQAALSTDAGPAVTLPLTFIAPLSRWLGRKISAT